MGYFNQVYTRQYTGKRTYPYKRAQANWFKLKRKAIFKNNVEKALFAARRYKRSIKKGVPKRSNNPRYATFQGNSMGYCQVVQGMGDKTGS